MRRFLAAAALCFALAWTVPSPAQSLSGLPVVVGTGQTLVVKSKPGTLLDGYVTTSAAGYLYIFNQTAAPTNGSYTAGTASGDYQDCIYLPAAGTYTFSSFGLIGENFSAGVVLAWSSTGCGTLTLASPLFLQGRVNNP